MGIVNYEKIYADHFAPSIAKSTDLVIERGEGPYVFTVNGDRYLDLVQGIAVNALGHCPLELVESAYEQMKLLGHAAFHLANFPSTLKLGLDLSRVTPPGLDMFMLTNSGAEAVEGALKLSRYLTKRPSFISFRGGFHGRTIGAASVTSSKAGFRNKYAPFTPEVYFAPYPYCFRCSFNQKPDFCDLECLRYLKEDLEYIIPPQDVAAVIFELVQGEGGYVVPPKRYVKALREMCDTHGWLLIADEVQTGIGRTGKMFACEYFDLVPDIICIGKALGGGFPMAAVASRKSIMEKWAAGSHGSTFGGHPVAAASALTQICIIKNPTFLKSVETKGRNFRQKLNKLKERHTSIGEVRGLGLMNAIELVKPDGNPDPDAVQNVIKKLKDNRVLVTSCGAKSQAIRFIPPLNIKESLLNQVIKILDNILA